MERRKERREKVERRKERRKKVERRRGAVHMTIYSNIETLTVSSILYPQTAVSIHTPLHPSVPLYHTAFTIRTSVCPSFSRGSKTF